jgi:hypothetical protein
MKRDMSLVRKILLAIEKDGIEAIQVDKRGLDHHLALMIDGGLLFGKYRESGETTGEWSIYGISWKGYDFLELIRDPARWDRVKKTADAINCHSFDVIVRLAEKAIRDYDGVDLRE